LTPGILSCSNSYERMRYYLLAGRSRIESGYRFCHTSRQVCLRKSDRHTSTVVRRRFEVGTCHWGPSATSAHRTYHPLRTHWSLMVTDGKTNLSVVNMWYQSSFGDLGYSRRLNTSAWIPYSTIREGSRGTVRNDCADELTTIAGRKTAFGDCYLLTQLSLVAQNTMVGKLLSTSCHCKNVVLHS
jgi:hypothetical protein